MEKKQQQPTKQNPAQKQTPQKPGQSSIKNPQQKKGF